MIHSRHPYTLEHINLGVTFVGGCAELNQNSQKGRDPYGDRLSRYADLVLGEVLLLTNPDGHMNPVSVEDAFAAVSSVINRQNLLIAWSHLAYGYSPAALPDGWVGETTSEVRKLAESLFLAGTRPAGSETSETEDAYRHHPGLAKLVEQGREGLEKFQERQREQEIRLRTQKLLSGVRQLSLLAEPLDSDLPLADRPNGLSIDDCKVLVAQLGHDLEAERVYTRGSKAEGVHRSRQHSPLLYHQSVLSDPRIVGSEILTSEGEQTSVVLAEGNQDPGNRERHERLSETMRKLANAEPSTLLEAMVSMVAWGDSSDDVCEIIESNLTKILAYQDLAVEVGDNPDAMIAFVREGLTDQIERPYGTSVPRNPLLRGVPSESPSEYLRQITNALKSTMINGSPEFAESHLNRIWYILCDVMDKAIVDNANVFKQMVEIAKTDRREMA